IRHSVQFALDHRRRTRSCDRSTTPRLLSRATDGPDWDRSKPSLDESSDLPGPFRFLVLLRGQTECSKWPSQTQFLDSSIGFQKRINRGGAEIQRMEDRRWRITLAFGRLRFNLRSSILHPRPFPALRLRAFAVSKLLHSYRRASIGSMAAALCAG